MPTAVVDSNEMAFRIASAGAFREAFMAAKPSILEPIMKVRFIGMRMMPHHYTDASNSLNEVLL